MTTLDDWKALQADVDAATGPDGEIDRVLAGFCGVQPYPFTASLYAVTALIERELPEWGHQVGRPMQTYFKKGYYASVFREATEDERKSALWMPGHFSAGREYGANYSESEMGYFPSPALALLAAFIRATIAQLEQAERAA